MRVPRRSFQRRSRIGAISTVAVASAGLFLSACSMTSSTSTTPTTTPAIVHTGERPVDIGGLRLWIPWSPRSRLPDDNWGVVPTTWTCEQGTSTDRCATVPCAPGPSPDVYVTTVAPLHRCLERVLLMNRDAVWVRLSKGPWTTRANGPVLSMKGWDTPAVRVTLPSLGVILYGFGPVGVRVAEGHQTSSLYDLTHAILPVSTPSGWRTIKFGNVEASVPAPWTVHDFALKSEKEVPPPTGCLGIGFASEPSRAAVFLGDSRYVPECPYFDPAMQWTWQSSPGYGLWLETIAKAEGPTPPPSSRIVHVVSIAEHGLTVQLFLPAVAQPAGTVSFAVISDGRTTQGSLGLGGAPLLAQQLLSSIRPRTSG